MRQSCPRAGIGRVSEAPQTGQVRVSAPAAVQEGAEVMVQVPKRCSWTVEEGGAVADDGAAAEAVVFDSVGVSVIIGTVVAADVSGAVGAEVVGGAVCGEAVGGAVGAAAIGGAVCGAAVGGAVGAAIADEAFREEVAADAAGGRAAGQDDAAEAAETAEDGSFRDPAGLSEGERKEEIAPEISG